ncbi:proepiregulin, partial [Petaurus breviceps papuanus]|uniref:proepiregulin n=1 Tax=Petaurus breviceps papuanus TaxID=3040969 RepID=UPI0036D7F306
KQGTGRVQLTRRTGPAALSHTHSPKKALLSLKVRLTHPQLAGPPHRSLLGIYLICLPPKGQSLGFPAQPGGHPPAPRSAQASFPGRDSPIPPFVLRQEAKAWTLSIRMDSYFWKISAVLFTIGLCLLQDAHNTTVIPSCIPGESDDNCTTLVQIDNNPWVTQVPITKCGEDMQGLCLHGQCIYVVDESQHFCRCELGYTGRRCEHFLLTVQKPLSKEYVVLTVVLIILFVVVIAGSTYYFLRWYKNRKSKESNKEYERVTLNDEKNSTLLQV